jgi:dethiobiotin synthetase
VSPAAFGFFVTGTDTGVGKTLVSCALLHALAGRGLRVVGMKPLAAGAERLAGKLRNDDAVALQAASNVSAPDDLVNPYCFAPPIAPHIAAAEAGVEIALDRIEHAYRGLRVPLGPDVDMRELAVRLALPVVLVVGMRLGCLSHALLTAESIAAAGLKLAGWTANHIDPHMPRADENVRTLEARLRAPLLARIAYSGTIDAAHAARNFKLELLRLPSHGLSRT